MAPAPERRGIGNCRRLGNKNVLIDPAQPSIKAQSFICPHCHARSHQFWYKCYASAVKEDSSLNIVDVEIVDKLRIATHQNPNEFQKFFEFAKAACDGRPMIDGHSSFDGGQPIANLSMSVCYSCKKGSLWCGRDLVYPIAKADIQAHPDLLGEARRDFEEAAAIIDSSPRGAAALLRLAIQRLLKDLGQPGKNINDDIGALVRDGLPVKIQRALDVVRVIGNNAVHPGELDMRDDKATAMSLFTLVNMIVENTITQGRQLDEMFSSLPQRALEAIEKRDKPKAT